MANKADVAVAELKEEVEVAHIAELEQLKANYEVCFHLNVSQWRFYCFVLPCFNF